MSRIFLLLLAGLKFGKLFGTVGTMLIAVGVYAIVFGWRYAIGIVTMLFVHEMGHYLAARQRGLAVRLPMFIPFAFAWTTLEDIPHDAETEAYIGLAGPMLGTVGAIGRPRSMCKYMGCGRKSMTPFVAPLVAQAIPPGGP